MAIVESFINHMGIIRLFNNDIVNIYIYGI